jgi:carbon storage regulator
MLVLSRKKDERILIGDGVVVQVIEVRGDKVRIGIVAPPDVAVDREEVRESKNRVREARNRSG